MYEDDLLKRIPYRLHAVVVHEGQTSGGHYWVYIFDHIKKNMGEITVMDHVIHRGYHIPI